MTFNQNKKQQQEVLFIFYPDLQYYQKYTYTRYLCIYFYGAISLDNTVACVINWGSFNNYVYQILPNFDPLPSRVDKHGHFKYYLCTLCYLIPLGLITDPSYPLLFHIVIECPPVKIMSHAKKNNSRKSILTSEFSLELFV